MELNKETVRILENDNREWTTNFECPVKILSLCNQLKSSEKEESLNSEDLINAFSSGFCDYPEIAESLPCQMVQEAEYPKISQPAYNKAELSEHLIKAVESKTSSVREIVDIVSNIDSEELQMCLVDTWSKIKKKEGKVTFINLLSAHPTCCQIMCRNILLPEFRIEDNFYSILEIVAPTVHLLQTTAVSELFIPLITEDSILQTDTFLKDIIKPLSPSQKTDFLSCFIGLMEKDIKVTHLQTLSLLLEEVPLNDSLISKIVALFSRSVSQFSDDRNFGKIILTVLGCCTSATTQAVIKDIAQISSNYKGMMRFRINTALKKFT